MKSIQSSLQRWMNENENFKKIHAKMKKEVLSHPEIKAFLHKYPEISAKEIDKKLNKLYEYTTQSIQCDRCENFDQCINIVKGYSPILQNINGEIHIAYEKCHSHYAEERKQEERQLIQSMYMPKEILEARIEKIDITPGRTEAIKEMSHFLDEAKRKLPERGLFLSGLFGVGKTYFLGAIANRLKQLNISSVIIYMPEFVREMREAIGDNTVQEKINVFKEADVLMLDDIGAETMSAWFRDEVLGSILQYRMMERLPVFFTSNYTMDQLEEVLATSTKGDVDKVKAGRIMERIRQVSKEVIVTGENRRNY